MAKLSDLITHAVEDKPSEFYSAFSDLMKDHLSDEIHVRKIELSQDLFGAPETTPEEDEEPKEPEKKEDDKDENV